MRQVSESGGADINCSPIEIYLFTIPISNIKSLHTNSMVSRVGS